MQLVNRFQELWLVIIFVSVLFISILMIYIGQNSLAHLHYSVVDNFTKNLSVSPTIGINKTILVFPSVASVSVASVTVASVSNKNVCERFKRLSNYRLQPKQFCSSTFHHLKLLILVCVAVGDKERRNAIRETWGAESRKEESYFRVAFVMGDARSEADNLLVKKEAEQFRDIIQDDSYLDTYENLTIKSLSALNWFSQYCGHVDFLVKTDADVFLNVPVLMYQIAQSSKSPFIIGALQHRAAVARAEGNKWRVSFADWPDSFYPDYVSGSCYLLSNKAVFHMFLSCNTINKLFIWEDIFITGILAQAANVRRIHNGGFSYTLRNLENLCDYKRCISSHRVNADQLRYIWKQLPLTSC